MAYIDPHTVASPKSLVRSVEVLYNDGPGSWSAALVNYANREHVGIRWNGSDEQQGLGSPQSRATPVWFIVPNELAELVREKAEMLANAQDGSLLERYQAMGNDQERETEADEWCEGLIGDGTEIDKKG